MGRQQGMRPAFALGAVLVLIVGIPLEALGQPATFTGFTAKVFADGMVRLTYEVDVDERLPRVTIQTIGETKHNLLVMDHFRAPLEYSLTGRSLTIITLGSTRAIVAYDTPDLTGKTGRVWTLSLELPVPGNILLPEGAAIVGLTRVPTLISTVEGRALLVVPEGAIQVSYTLGLPGTREYALSAMLEAGSVVEAIRRQGIVVMEAEAILSEARRSFDAGDYLKVASLVPEARTKAIEANKTGVVSVGLINDAESSIQRAISEGRTAGVDDAKMLLDQARLQHSKGSYLDAQRLARLALERASQAPAPLLGTQFIASGANQLAVVGAIAASVAVASAVLLKRRRPAPAVIPKRQRSIDSEKVLRAAANLRIDDQEVLRFLAAAGGEAMESEIREKFSQPKTTAWRMIKRLEREGFVEVVKLGGQNLVRIRSEYEA